MQEEERVCARRAGTGTAEQAGEVEETTFALSLERAFAQGLV